MTCLGAFIGTAALSPISWSTVMTARAAVMVALFEIDSGHAAALVKHDVASFC